MHEKKKYQMINFQVTTFVYIFRVFCTAYLSFVICLIYCLMIREMYSVYRCELRMCFNYKA